MSYGANYAVGTPQRRKVVRRPRVFLLEDGSQIISATRDSSESMMSREVSSVSDNSVVTSKKIVRELTKNLEEIMQEEEAEEEITPQVSTETSSSLSAQKRIIHESRETNDGGSMLEEGEEEEEEEDRLPVYEGTNPICCAADVSPEVSQYVVTSTYYLSYAYNS